MVMYFSSGTRALRVTSWRPAQQAARHGAPRLGLCLILCLLAYPQTQNLGFRNQPSPIEEKEIGYTPGCSVRRLRMATEIDWDRYIFLVFYWVPFWPEIVLLQILYSLAQRWYHAIQDVPLRSTSTLNTFKENESTMLYPNNIGKAIINHPYLDGLYHHL